MLMPPISRYMTLAPAVIGPDEAMARAHELMRTRRIRHLPVVHRGGLVGVVSERDLQLMETLCDVDPAIVTVGEAMTRTVYAVAPDTPMNRVIAEMLERRLGSAVVVGDAGIEGIFTTADGLRALLDVLDREAS
jgi:acetoin utilization protein AcuB